MDRQGMREGMYGAGAEFEGKQNWIAPETPRNLDKPLSLNRFENQAQLADIKKDELMKKFGNVVMALGARSEKISQALGEIVATAESSPQGLSVLEGLDNEYFSVESLASQSLDMDNENAIVDLLQQYKNESDSKQRVKISRQIEELR